MFSHPSIDDIVRLAADIYNISSQRDYHLAQLDDRAYTGPINQGSSKECRLRIESAVERFISRHYVE